ncbi:hypothetical protein BGI05_00325 [Snodgrassella alvi]|uniref:hypothetical protein n=1 Tax=Snodgrassella alvi TaxID=1196083 RepID=UPI0009FDFAD8|nr:hypothetical protein [Snodgrassella alvi]ORF02461.1 hypothetical protein BGH97_04790 [Snodgrassella alvi]ORF09942.1 hypothetical protein BGH99_00530 [Snodgrassella alvi]ORF15390.1 hypothetical protein BGI02_03130 [Snodgrassella alvi]ORF16160.1 hypothetical protein BGI00_00105 [Snodgrassella alvi]ORF23300.1 hypothetical protein BGI05_00325 [Snodgrassella alvi]
MDIKNLYALLNIKPTASRLDIAKAMKQAAQQQTITLEDLKLCKLNLLDVEARKQYNARLFAEYPELLTPPEPESVEKAKPQPPAKTKQGNKKLYLILVVVIALITGTAAYFMYSKLIAEAKEAVRNTLKNLDSAEFYHVEMSVNTHYKEHIYVCGEVEGKTLDGGYTGIKKFVYRLKSKKAIVISNKRSNDIMLEYADSFSYRVGCLNADPAELIKVVKSTDTYLEELRSLTSGRPALENNFEREELIRSIVNVIAKIKADRKKITIYADSDDD